MAQRKADPTSALVTVVKALEPLEPDERQWVLSSAANKWALILQLAAGTPGSPAGPGVSTPDGEGQQAIAQKDPRAFIRAKRPTTDIQRVTCIVYYLMKTTGQHGFPSKDINETYTLSGESKINMTRALDNATRRSKYLSNRGPREKQLTPLGEDVVEALPDQGAVKELDASVKSRGRSKKKSKKKRRKKV